MGKNEIDLEKNIIVYNSEFEFKVLMDTEMEKKEKYNDKELNFEGEYIIGQRNGKEKIF